MLAHGPSKLRAEMVAMQPSLMGYTISFRVVRCANYVHATPTTLVCDILADGTTRSFATLTQVRDLREGFCIVTTSPKPSKISWHANLGDA